MTNKSQKTVTLQNWVSYDNTITGTIYDVDSPIPDVTVTFGDSFTTATDASGIYCFSRIKTKTTGTIIPSKTGYEFRPASIDISAISGNLSGLDFQKI